MSQVQKRLKAVLEDVEKAGHQATVPTLIAVSKTFDALAIEPALDAGHLHFGENRVQESQKKWPGLREKYADVILHLIGPLQSNKASDAVALFDVIHTVDREKIAKTLSAEMKRQDRSLKVFIQINVGLEAQKAGILPHEADEFIDRCLTVHELNVVGLMCIPPVNEPAKPYFRLLAEIAARHDLKELSMGMSSDYKEAISMGATFVRVGSAVFGSRSVKPEKA